MRGEDECVSISVWQSVSMCLCKDILTNYTSESSVMLNEIHEAVVKYIDILYLIVDMNIVVYEVLMIFMQLCL